MGQKLLEFYNEVVELGQAKARMRLAMLTRVSSVQAAQEPDSAENIKKFQEALQEIKKEFHA